MLLANHNSVYKSVNPLILFLWISKTCPARLHTLKFLKNLSYCEIECSFLDSCLVK